jgi:hypothetical protein
VAGLSQQQLEPGRKLCVDKDLQRSAATSTGWSASAAEKARQGMDIFFVEIGEIAQHFGFAYTSREKIENILHPDAHAADTRATATLVWVKRDAIHNRNPNSHTAVSKGSNTRCSRVLTPSTSHSTASPGRPHCTSALAIPERLIPALDCGIKYIPRDLAFAKLKASAEGATIVRRELTGVRAA